MVQFFQESRVYIVDILHIKTWYQIVINVILSVFTGFYFHVKNLAIDNLDAMHTIAIILIVDWILGMYRALITVDKATGKSLFETKKSFKILAYFLAYFALLFITGSIEKSFNYAAWLTEAVMIPILVGQVISILKNMSLVGWISNKMLSDILQKIDGYKDDIVDAAINGVEEDINKP